MIFAKTLLTVALILASGLPSGAADDTPWPVRLPDDVWPTHYSVTLEVDPAADRFSGEVRIAVALATSLQHFWIHGRGLEVTEAFLELAGERIAVSYEEVEGSGYADLRLQRAVGPGEALLVIRYHAPFGQSLEGLYAVQLNGLDYAYTHFEPIAARQAIPGFDEPRFKVPFDIAVTIPAGMGAVSNAPERETTIGVDGRKSVVFATTEPLPTYLIALAIGTFDVVQAADIPPNAVRALPIPLRGIAPLGLGDRFGQAFVETGALIERLEGYFGIAFPYAKLDLVAVPEFGPHGMENAGAIFFSSDRILIGDAPSIGDRRGFSRLNAHELAHSWFGDLVTPAWWDDLWLNEAFATWMSDRVLHDWNPAEFDERGPIRGARDAMWYDRLDSARPIYRSVLSDADIKNAFDDITYLKGGGLLAMIEGYMGDAEFRDGIRRFLQRHRHGVATSADFHAALTEGEQNPLIAETFISYLGQAGTPLVAVDWSCDATGAATVRLTQSRGLPLGAKGETAIGWTIPLCLAYRVGDSQQRQCLSLSKQTESAVLPTTLCPLWVHPNAGGTAYLNFTLPREGWDALLADLDRLSPGEALAVIGSVHRAYEMGLTNSAQLLAAATAAARSPFWDVVAAPIQSLRDLKNYVVPAAARDRAVARMQAIYRPALQAIDLSDAALAKESTSTQEELLRGDLLWFVALDAEEPALRGRLTRLAKAYLGYDGDGAANPGALHPNLVRVALLAAGGEAEPAFVEAMIDRLRHEADPVLRGLLIHALGFQTKPDIVARVGALILDPTITSVDAAALLRRQANRAANQAAIFDWIVANHDTLRQRLPASQLPYLVWRVSGFCSLADRDRVASYFGAVADTDAHSLASVLESIEICAAMADAQRAGALQALGGGD